MRGPSSCQELQAHRTLNLVFHHINVPSLTCGPARSLCRCGFGLPPSCKSSEEAKCVPVEQSPTCIQSASLPGGTSASLPVLAHEETAETLAARSRSHNGTGDVYDWKRHSLEVEAPVTLAERTANRRALSRAVNDVSRFGAHQPGQPTAGKEAPRALVSRVFVSGVVEHRVLTHSEPRRTL